MDSSGPPISFDAEDGRFEARFGHHTLRLKGAALPAFALGVAAGALAGAYAATKAIKLWREVQGGDASVRLVER